jgi:histidinol-phosphate aminotransferase
MAVETPAHSLDDVLSLIRPAVRNEHEYVVGTPPDVSVKLNQNESPFDVPDAVKADLLEAFASIPFNRYPSEQPDRLRRALAKHDGVDPEGVIVGNGSNELTYTFGLAFIDPGTPVVLPRPMFSLYEKVAHLYGGDVTSIPPCDDLTFDVDAIVEAVRETQATLTILTTPNNPTGHALSIREIERVVAASPGIVVVDEAYVEFNPEGSAKALLDTYPNVVLLRTLSKAFGLAGLRLGYLVARPEMTQELMKSRLPFMVDRFSEQVALTLLDHPGLLQSRVEQMQASTAALADALRARDGVDVVPTAANFVIFRPPVHGSVLHERLVEEGVLVRDMSGYPELDGYLRVSGGTPEENKAFVAALDRTLRAV